MPFGLHRDGDVNRRILLFSIATMVTIASATPSITFPLNSQVPPVARVDKPFSFTLSSSTFTSDTAIRYSLKNGPAWLSLDGETRTLLGTPPKDAEDVVEVEIEATDSAGSAIMSSTLVVKSSPPPEVVVPFSQQVDKFADYSAPNLLLFYPSTSFRFSFDQATFEASGKARLNKYAVTLDNAPLPSWITFDETTMTFSGETPDSRPLISPPEKFGIQLIASEIFGFGEVSIPFFFMVQNHKLMWKDSFLDIKVEAGSLIDFMQLRGQLVLDGKPIVASDLVSITSDAPNWLKFDAATFALFGLVPNDVSSLNVTITATDKFDDVASVMISVDVFSGLFRTEAIQPLYATIGQPFSFDISSVFAGGAPIDILVSFLPVTPWLSYDPQTFILAGEVPNSTTATLITVTIRNTITSPLDRTTGTQKFTINIFPPLPEISVPSSAANTPSAAPSYTLSTLAGIARHAKSNKGIAKGKIAAAVIVPNFLLILAASLLFWCWRRRQQRQLIEKSGFVPMKKIISRPQLFDSLGLLTPSSFDSGIHPVLRSHCSGFNDDTSIFTRPEHGRRSISLPELRRSISSMTFDLLHRPPRGPIFDKHITYGVPPLPPAYPPDNSNKAGIAQVKEKKKLNSKWRYQPYRTFSDPSQLSRGIQVTPEASCMKNHEQYRISNLPRTRSCFDPINDMPTQRYLGRNQERTSHNLRNYSTTTQIAHRQSGHDQGLLGCGGPEGASADIEETWQEVYTSPQMSLGRGKPSRNMSAVTENMDMHFECSQLPRLPLAAVIATSPSDRQSINYLNRRSTIRLVSYSSNYLPETLPSSNTLESSSSSGQHSITRRGGSSPFFGDSACTNSKPQRRRSAKIIEGDRFTNEMDTTSISRGMLL